MIDEKLLAVLLAAGRGTRMRAALPKPLTRLNGVPLVQWVLAAVEPLCPVRMIVVIGPGMDTLAAEVAPIETVVQPRPDGPGGAIRATRAISWGFGGDIMILPADAPMITTAMLRETLALRRGIADPAVVVVGTHVDPPDGYGRLILGSDGRLDAIVEDKDALPAQQRLTLCNAGPMVVDGVRLWDLLSKVENRNAAGEYYSTDMVAIACALGWRCDVSVAENGPVLSVNTPEELIRVEMLMRNRWTPGG